MSPTTGAGNYAGDKVTAVMDEVGETATTAVNTEVLECALFIKSGIPGVNPFTPPNP